MADLVCSQCRQRKPRAPGTFAGNRGLCPDCYSKRPKCLHCNRRIRRTSGGGRGLCFGCYYTPQIRNLYPPFQVRTQDIPAAGRPLPEAATDAEPGTPEKLVAMAQRLSLQQQLFHPFDRWLGDEVGG